MPGRRRLPASPYAPAALRPDDVTRLAGACQGADGPEDQPMVGTVEVLFADRVGYLIPGADIEQQAAENGLLCLDGVRRSRSIHLGDRAALATRFGGTGHRGMFLAWCGRLLFRHDR